MAEWDTFGSGGQGSAANGGNREAAVPSWLDSWSTLLGMTPSAYQADPYVAAKSGGPQVVSRQAVGGTRYQQIKLDDGSTEFRDENDQPVSADAVRYALQGVGQSTGASGQTGTPAAANGQSQGYAPVSTTNGSTSGTMRTRASMPSWYSLLDMDKTLGSSSSSGNVESGGFGSVSKISNDQRLSGASNGLDASTPSVNQPATPTVAGTPRFRGMSFEPELRVMTPVSQAPPQVVSERGYDPSSKEVVYNNNSRKIFLNNHELAAVGKAIPSIDSGKNAYEYQPAPDFIYVDNPLWGRRDQYSDAHQYRGIRSLVYDDATGLFRAQFNNSAGGVRYYDRQGNRVAGPVGSGGVTPFSAAVQGMREAFGNAGDDVKRGAPILGKQIKDFGNATSDTIQGLVTHGGDYVGAKALEGRAIWNNDPAAAARARVDQANDLAYLRSMADVLTPGTLKDLASSAGSLAGGDKKAALHTIQGIGLNYKREMHENPVGFTINAASVVLPFGGVALKAAVDMDRLAVAYDAINDSRMAARARAWRDLYRERSAIGQTREPTPTSYGRARASNPDIGGDKQWPNIGNDGYLIGPRRVGFGGRRWTTHDYSEVTDTNAKGQMIGFGKLKPNVEAETDAYGNIMINDNLQGDPTKIERALAHELGHRRFTVGGKPGLVQDLRARAGDWGYNHAQGIKYLEEVLTEKEAGADWKSAHDHAMDPYYEIDPAVRNRDGLMYLGTIGLVGNALGNYMVDKRNAHIRRKK